MARTSSSRIDAGVESVSEKVVPVRFVKGKVTKVTVDGETTSKSTRSGKSTPQAKGRNSVTGRFISKTTAKTTVQFSPAKVVSAPRKEVFVKGPKPTVEFVVRTGSNKKLAGLRKDPNHEVFLRLGSNSSPYQRELIAALTVAALEVDEKAGKPEDVAARMVASIPRSDPWDDVAGPFYDSAGLAEWLGFSRQRVHQLASVGDILAVKTGDGTTLYPAWQFGYQGQLLPGLRSVLEVLDPAIGNRWTIAGWLNARLPDDEDKSAADLMREGSAEDVLAEARENAWQLTQ